MAVDLVFETHSISVDNERGVATGWFPGELSAEGRELATRVGARRCDVDVVFVSDLRRAVETAEIAFGGTEIPVQLDERLRECNYGELNGAPVAVMEAERPARIDVPFPGGQSYRDCVEQMRDFLAEVARAHDGRQVLVIGHAATWMSLEHLLNGRPLDSIVMTPRTWQEGWRYRLDAGGPVPPGS